jgi:Uma2 family endonuclease
MATTTNLLSWEAFEQLPDDGMHHEIIEGELITLPPSKSCHSEVAMRVLDFAIQQRIGWRAFAEAGYKLSDDPPTWIQPDVSLIRKERVKATDPEGYFFGALELAIEVVSPSESAADVDRKVDLMLAHGSKAVWVAFPRTKKVQVYLADGTSFSRGINSKLSLTDLAPGWERPVATLFE